MRRLRWVILGVVVAVFGALILPPYLDLRRMNEAVAGLEVLSDAAQRYADQTGTTAPNPQALLVNPGVKGWAGPYLDSEEALKTPWGGRYVFDVERGLVGIAPENARAPEKYRLGGAAELSMPIRSAPKWWPAHAVQR